MMQIKTITECRRHLARHRGVKIVWLSNLLRDYERETDEGRKVVGRQISTAIDVIESEARAGG